MYRSITVLKKTFGLFFVESSIVKTLSHFWISCFCGESKQENLNDFLSGLVDEFNDLSVNWLLVDRTSWTKSNNCWCSSEKLFERHGFTHGLSRMWRCIQEGVRIERHLTYQNFDAPKRSDAKLRSRADSHHHVKCETRKWMGENPLLRIQGLDKVKDIVLDPIHLVYLGIIRRLIIKVSLVPAPCYFCRSYFCRRRKPHF